MKWNQVVHLLSAKYRLSRAAAERLARELFWWVANETQSSGRFVVPGFGVFATKTRKARRIVNVLDGVEMRLPETTEIRFRKAKRFGRRA